MMTVIGVLRAAVNNFFIYLFISGRKNTTPVRPGNRIRDILLVVAYTNR